MVEWGEATSSRRGDNCSGFKIVELYSLFLFLNCLLWIGYVGYCLQSCFLHRDTLISFFYENKHISI